MPVNKVVSSAEARASLASLLNEIEDLGEHVIITRRGKPLAILLSYEEYERLLETLDVLSDPELMKAVQEGEEDIKRGDIASLNEYLKDREERLA
ncbi:MAG: type II toxin-antitoxin system Phd/YefM family antitoxin [Candidatus Aquicultor sp.]|nr:type II toxin-antitoxin system Phd/YefM family antitoxin [Candidatus Aquicultor sp.]